MILLPNKHLTTSRSLIGLGSLLLQHLASPTTVSGLWELVKNREEVGSYHNFVLSLDYLYAIGAINYDGGFISRSR